MYTSYEQKYKFVTNRVELDHARRFRSQAGIARLERPGSLFDGGYDDAFGEADDDGDGPEAGSEAVAPSWPVSWPSRPCQTPRARWARP